jgi:hypothetical protein
MGVMQCSQRAMGSKSGLAPTLCCVRTVALSPLFPFPTCTVHFLSSVGDGSRIPCMVSTFPASHLLYLFSPFIHPGSWSWRRDRVRTAWLWACDQPLFEAPSPCTCVLVSFLVRRSVGVGRAVRFWKTVPPGQLPAPHLDISTAEIWPGVSPTFTSLFFLIAHNVPFPICFVTFRYKLAFNAWFYSFAGCGITWFIMRMGCMAVAP